MELVTDSGQKNLSRDDQFLDVAHMSFHSVS